MSNTSRSSSLSQPPDRATNPLRPDGRVARAAAAREARRSRRRRLKKRVGRVAWILQWVTTGLMVLAIYMGWAGAVMVSGESMLPVLENGDIVVFTRSTQYDIGDIAVFNIPEGVGQGQSVIHRIVDGSPEDGWTFQGDNRDLQDPWLVRDQDIVGTPRFVVPGGTQWLRLAADRSPFVIAGLVTLMVAITTFPGGDKQDKHDKAAKGRKTRRKQDDAAPVDQDVASTVDNPSEHR